MKVYWKKIDDKNKIIEGLRLLFNRLSDVGFCYSDGYLFKDIRQLSEYDINS